MQQGGWEERCSGNGGTSVEGSFTETDEKMFYNEGSVQHEKSNRMTRIWSLSLQDVVFSEIMKRYFSGMEDGKA